LDFEIENFGFRISDFEIENFGFRISDFGFAARLPARL